MTVKVFPVSRGTVQLTGSGERMSICSGDFTRVGSGGDLTNAGSASISSLFCCWSESYPSSPSPGAAPSAARLISIFSPYKYYLCSIPIVMKTIKINFAHLHINIAYLNLQFDHH